MNRLELIRAAGWDVPRFVRAVADEQGCTCVATVCSGGFVHSHKCRVSREKYPWREHMGTHQWFDLDAVERVEAQMRADLAAVTYRSAP